MPLVDEMTATSAGRVVCWMIAVTRAIMDRAVVYRVIAAAGRSAVAAPMLLLLPSTVGWLVVL